MNAKPSVVFLNGEFVPELEARVSVHDRSFLYGDGLFETLRVYRGRPFRWTQHVARLLCGARLLRLNLPLPVPDLEARALELIRLNERPDATLRLHLSRGVGPRGYSPAGAKTPLLLMTLHPAPNVSPARPASVSLRSSGWRLQSGGTLGSCKSTSRLLHVLARADAEAAGAGEALMLNELNQAVEASSANFFWIHADRVHTPPLDSGALDGVTRRTVLELCATLKIKAAETPLPSTALKRVGAAFLTSSIQEIARVTELDSRPLPLSTLIDQLHHAYRDQVRRECP